MSQPEIYILRLDPDQTPFSFYTGHGHITLSEIKFEAHYTDFETNHSEVKTPFCIQAVVDFREKHKESLYKEMEFTSGLSEIINAQLGIPLTIIFEQQRANTFDVMPNNQNHTKRDIVTKLREITGKRLDIAPEPKSPEEPAIATAPASKMQKTKSKNPLLGKFRFPSLQGTVHGSPRGHEFNITAVTVQGMPDDPTGPKSIDGVGYIQLRVSHDYHTELLRSCGDPWFLTYILEDLQFLGLAVEIGWDHEDTQSAQEAVFSLTPVAKNAEKNILNLMRYLYNKWCDENEEEGEANDETFALPG
jgi:hypothetical protein